MRVDSYGILAGLLSTIGFVSALFYSGESGLFSDLGSFILFLVVFFVVFALIGFGCSRASGRSQRRDRIRFAVFTFGTAAASFPIVVVAVGSWYYGGLGFMPPPDIIVIFGGLGLLFGGYASAGSVAGGYASLRYSASHSGQRRITSPQAPRSYSRSRTSSKYQGICAKCSFHNPQGHNFCGRCGFPLTDETRVY